MTEHTPGPWIIDTGNGSIYAKRGVSFDSESDLVEEVAVMRATCVTDRWEADARLIAAAPDLLAALKVAREYVAAGAILITPDLLRIDVAIAKAEGR